MKQIRRQRELNLLLSLKDKDVIKLITGIRRCGKSTLIQMYRDILIGQGVAENQIFYANFENIENSKWLQDYQGLYDHIKASLNTDSNCYIFLDEVQQVEKFERLIDGLFVLPNFDIYITGSNGNILSSEMGTLLTGRYISIPLLPFSFAEFVEASENSDRLDALFQDYLQVGGFPGVVGLDSSVRNIYLNDILTSILEKDILKRNHWRKSDNFLRIIKFMLESIGSELSVNNITNTLRGQGYEISNHTVAEYISALKDSFLFYKANRFDIKGKKILSTGEKYYSADLGLINALQGTLSSNLGHRLENVVYLELLRRGYNVWIGKIDAHEIDFITQSQTGETEYYQVAWSSLNQETLEREITPFTKAKDFNRRVLLTTDPEKQSTHNGILKLNIVDWLLS